MNYKEFMEQVKEDLPKHLTGVLEDASVNVTQVGRLQGLSYEGISIVPGGSIMGMTMDLQPYYQLLNVGMTYENILNRLAETAESTFADRPDLSIETLGNYDEVKDRLMIQLVGRDGNEEMLQTIPHHSIEDMEIVYRLHIQDTEFGRASALVTNVLLDKYGITADQLRQDAFATAMLHDPYEIKTMAEILNELMGDDVIPEGELPLYVASNKERMNGAGVITYPGFMEEASERLGGDFYVLPSSLHEVILVPDTSELDADELQTIVQSVNADQVEPEDRLSDHVYHYDSREKVFERADKYESRKLSQNRESEDTRSSVLGILRDNQKNCSEKSHKNTALSRCEDAVL